MLVKSYTVGPVATNCYLLGDEATHLAALIDPGERGERLAGEVEQEGFSLAMILLTHAHFDHIGGVRGVLDAIHRKEPEREIPIYVHKADYPEAPASFMRGITLTGVPGVRFYGEGDTVQLGGITVSVLSTPGHTRGGVCLKAENYLFTGDTLFRSSCGRTDFETSSPKEMLASLRRLAQLEGDYIVCPGHEGTSTLEEERRSNPYIAYALKHAGS